MKTEIISFALLSAITVFLWWLANQKYKRGDQFNWPLLLLAYPVVLVISSIFKNGLPVTTLQVVKMIYILIWISGLSWSLLSIRRYHKKI